MKLYIFDHIKTSKTKARIAVFSHSFGDALKSLQDSLGKAIDLNKYYLAGIKQKGFEQFRERNLNHYFTIKK